MMTKKVIQTEVDPAVYQFVLKTAESKGLTPKEATRRALEEWAARAGAVTNPVAARPRPYREGHVRREDPGMTGRSGPVSR